MLRNKPGTTDTTKANSEETSFVEKASTPNKKSSMKRGGFSKYVIGAIILVALVYVGNKYWGSMSAKDIEKQNQTLISEISKIMILPAEQNPLFYEITDPSALVAVQPFFTGSEKGDKLVVFPQSGKALIYSTTRHVIVNAGPIQFDSQTQAQTKQPTQAAQASTPVKK